MPSAESRQREGAALAAEESVCGATGAAVLANQAKPMRYFGSRSPPKAGMAELADAADSKSAYQTEALL
jgi:hypothetical protein